MAVLLGGQPGSGKSALRAQAEADLKDRGGAVVVDADRMRALNPRYHQLLRTDPQNAADLTHTEAAAWSMQLTRAAVDHRRDLIIDGTLRDVAKVRDLVEHLRSRGYEVEARILAVSTEVSMARARLRYEHQVETLGTGRFVNQGQHDNAYAGIPDSVRALETEKLVDRLKVYDAAHGPIYENVLDRRTGEWRISPPQAADALLHERDRPRTYAEQRDLIAALDEIAALSATRMQQPDIAIEALRDAAKRQLAAIENSQAFQRATAFESLPTRDALARYPELDGAYAQLRDIRARFATLPPHLQEQAMDRGRSALLEQLHRGPLPAGEVSLEESRQAISIAAQHRAITSLRNAEELRRDFEGEVVAVSSHHILVKLSDRLAVISGTAHLDRRPEVGEQIRVLFGPEQSRVIERQPARTDERGGFERGGPSR